MKAAGPTGLKASVFAALALAFASFGDAFLYPFLPVNFNTAGIPVAWVGALLSVNRFVRILSNTLLVRVCSWYGLRAVMIVAVIFATLSTFGYGVATGLLAWLLLRSTWGLAFSALRIGALGYALQYQKRGLALGISRGLQEMGPMLSLLIAPVLVRYFNSETIFCILALMSLPSIYFAWRLPVGGDKPRAPESNRLVRWPTTLDSITFISALVIDGIVVVALGILFLQRGDQMSLMMATTLAAFCLGFRRICLVALSATGGWMAERMGLDRLFNMSMIFVILGLLMIAFGWIATGAVIVFIFHSVNSALTPGVASTNNTHVLAGVAENATWRDIGAATGTLLGGLLLSSQYLGTVLIVAIFVMAFLLFVHLGKAQKAIKLFYLWK